MADLVDDGGVLDRLEPGPDRRRQLHADVDPAAYVVNVVTFLVSTIAVQRLLAPLPDDQVLREVLRMARAALFRPVTPTPRTASATASARPRVPAGSSAGAAEGPPRDQRAAEVGERLGQHRRGLLEARFQRRGPVCYRRVVSQVAAGTARARALALVESIQTGFATALESVTAAVGAPSRFEAIRWQRDGGRHGGGVRLGAGDTAALDRASINVSQVHYDDEPDRALSSATALSTIIHPASPHAPSVHIHVSWTELRSGRAYWRLMADLNPAIPDQVATASFTAALRDAAPELAELARSQGDRYFWIPALGRHRGVTHFYLEDHATGDPDADEALARRVGAAATGTYARLLDEALRRATPITADDRARQLAYHTLYLFQVLTLDRGTTAGLLIHDQNDVGILGSLPARVDRALLGSWRARMPPPQDALLDAIVAALPDARPSPVDEPTKVALARALRAHYQAHPEALALQASGGVTVPTVANHRAG